MHAKVRFVCGLEPRLPERGLEPGSGLGGSAETRQAMKALSGRTC